MAYDNRRGFEYSREQLELAIALALEGRTKSFIIDALATTANSFYKYLEDHDAFRDNFSHAVSEGHEMLADELLVIPDIIPDVQKARLKSDNIKWILAKRKPQVYGERIEMNVTSTLDIQSVLAEAKQRVEARRSETIDVTPALESHTDSEDDGL